MRKQIIGMSFNTLLPARSISAAMFFALCSMLLAPCFQASAQQSTKVPRLGFLVASTADAQLNRTDSFHRGLRELGYVEGQNILIEYKYAEGDPDRLPELAAELVRLKFDVIVVQNNVVAHAASNATKTIPIVMADGADPVSNGLVASLARPGGNVTGLTNAATDLGVKRLELLKEIFPKLARVAVLPSPRSTRVLKELQAAALPYRSSFTSWRYGLPTI
jgi:ABC-type uncharacterized transport system substrate-binding protein